MQISFKLASDGASSREKGKQANLNFARLYRQATTKGGPIKNPPSALTCRQQSRGRVGPAKPAGGRLLLDPVRPFPRRLTQRYNLKTGDLASVFKFFIKTVTVAGLRRTLTGFPWLTLFPWRFR